MALCTLERRAFAILPFGWIVLVGVCRMVEINFSTTSIRPLLPVGMRCCKAAEAIRVAGLTLCVRDGKQVSARTTVFTVAGSALDVVHVDCWTW